MENKRGILVMGIILLLISISFVYAGETETNSQRSMLGVNLNGFQSWSPQVPFKDMALRGGSWYLKLNGNPEYLSSINYDENNYPISWPANTKLFGSIILGNGAKVFPNRTFIFLYDGIADLDFKVEQNPKTTFNKTREGRYVLGVVSGQKGINFWVKSTEVSNHLRNIRIIEERYENNYLTEPYQPEFLSFLQDFSAVRFMDWMHASIRTHPRYDFATGATANTISLSWGAISNNSYKKITGGNLTAINLSSSESLVNNTYNGKNISLIIGGVEYRRKIIDYFGENRTAILSYPLNVVPTANDFYLFESSMYVDKRIKVVHNNISQIKKIIDYNPFTKTATVDSAWNPVIEIGDEFFMEGGEVSLDNGRFTAVTTNTINLGLGASNQDDYYTGKIIVAKDGTQRRFVSDYDGTSHIATISANWDYLPVSSNLYGFFDFKQKEWAYRNKPSNYYSVEEKEVPVETMVELANTANVAPWFNIPSEASDDYIRQFATYVKNNLNPNLKIYIEYGNENWNPANYPGYDWCEAKGRETGIAGWDYSAHRSVEMFKIFDDVFGEAHLRADRTTSRIVRLLPCQGAYIENCRRMMDYTGTGLKTGYANPIASGKNSSSYADALAIAPYYGIPNSTVANDFLTKSESDIIAILIKNVEQHYTSAGLIYVNVRNARARGLNVVAYETGQDMSLTTMPSSWSVENKAIARAKLKSANGNPLMKTLYLNDLENWKALGANSTTTGTGVWMHFQDTYTTSDYGSWGLREYMWQPISEAPKWQAVHEFAQNQTSTPTPTCSDGIKNGLETGIDCGGICPACSNGSSGDTGTGGGGGGGGGSGGPTENIVVVQYSNSVLTLSGVIMKNNAKADKCIDCKISLKIGDYSSNSITDLNGKFSIAINNANINSGVNSVEFNVQGNEFNNIYNKEFYLV